MESEHLQNLDANRTLEPDGVGRARHSVRASLAMSDDGAHGVTRPTRFKTIRLETKAANDSSSPQAGTIQLNKTLALTPAQKILVLRRDCVRSPREREKLSSASPYLTTP